MGYRRQPYRRSPRRSTAVSQGVKKVVDAIYGTGLAGGALYYGSQYIDLANNEERAKEIAQWYNDWERNVGVQGIDTRIIYPMLSAVGGLPAALSNALSGIDTLYKPKGKKKRLL